MGFYIYGSDVTLTAFLIYGNSFCRVFQIFNNSIEASVLIKFNMKVFRPSDDCISL